MPGLKQREQASSGYVVFYIAAIYVLKTNIKTTLFSWEDFDHVLQRLECKKTE
uniref:hypothetical protein n=1 Tax=Bacillus cytotoxicus TaxID=580165 RepID=UPI00203F098C